MRVWMFFVLILSGAKRLVLACRPAAISTSDPLLLITGGRDKQGDKSTELTSVEVLTPYGVPLPCYCTVPPLPASRYDHTQDGLVACGGYGSTAVLTSCVTLTGSGWQESHQLQEERAQHVSWRSPAGLLLMGGHSNLTTELLTNTGSSSSPSFDLEYYPL